MALLERVSTLMRANLNDLLLKAEDPEKLARQLVLDMENQLLQVKTQMAIALADEHTLRKKKKEQEELTADWLRKAELAVGKGQDDLARSALERSVLHRAAGEGFARQLGDQSIEAETLRSTCMRLEQKLAETRVQVDLLTAQHRRNRAGRRIAAAQSSVVKGEVEMKLRRLKARIEESSSDGASTRAMLSVTSSESLEERMTSLGRNEQVEDLLFELKERQLRLAETTGDDHDVPTS